jgi:hypothetical protein
VVLGGSRRAAVALGVALPAIVGCGVHVRTAGPDPQAAPLTWGAGEPVCIVQPKDGGGETTVYAGSGAAVAKRIEGVVRANRTGSVILVEDLRACAAKHGRYAIVPTILRWHRHSGALFYSEGAQLQLSVRSVDDPAVLRAVSFETRRSQPNVLIGPHDLLPKEFDDAVLRLLSTS